MRLWVHFPDEQREWYEYFRELQRREKRTASNMCLVLLLEALKFRREDERGDLGRHGGIAAGR